MGYGLSDKMDFTWEVLHVYYISQLWYLWRILKSYLKDLDTDRTFKCHTHNHRVLNWNLLSSWLNCPNLTMKYMLLLCMISLLCYGIVDSAISRKGGKKKKKKETRNIEMYLTVMSFSVPPSRIDIEIGILITTC